MINLKRVYEPRNVADGYRVLVDALWPRGLTKEKAHIDLWMKEIAPSTELRQWYHHDATRWAEFHKRYLAELRASEREAALTELKSLAKEHKRLTLLFASRELVHNNAAVLVELLS